MSLTDDDRRALLETFAADVPVHLAALARALDELGGATDAEAVSHAAAALAAEAHTLRGAAAAVSLADLGALAADLEQSARELPAGRAGTRDVREAGRRVVEYLRAFAEAAGPPGEPGAATPPDELTVLHIEDNASNRKLVERVLARRERLRLVEAIDGEAGLALARSLRPDLVLLDLRLPDMSGEDVLRSLRAEPQTKGVMVVVISAEARPEESDRLLAAGADAYLVKPIDVESLLEVVDAARVKAGRPE